MAICISEYTVILHDWTNYKHNVNGTTAPNTHNPRDENIAQTGCVLHRHLNMQRTKFPLLTSQQLIIIAWLSWRVPIHFAGHLHLMLCSPATTQTQWTTQMVDTYGWYWSVMFHTGYNRRTMNSTRSWITFDCIMTGPGPELLADLFSLAATKLG